jgi:hypothetical protein
MTKSELKQLIRETIEEIGKKSVSEKPRFSLKKSAYGSEMDMFIRKDRIATIQDNGSGNFEYQLANGGPMFKQDGDSVKDVAQILYDRCQFIANHWKVPLPLGYTEEGEEDENYERDMGYDGREPEEGS